MKKYKIAGKKCDENEVRQVINSSLEFIINENDKLLKRLSEKEIVDFVEKAEKEDYAFSIEKSMISMLNNKWQSSIVGEKAKNVVNLEQDDLKWLTKDVSKTLKASGKFHKFLNKLIDSASTAKNSGSERYASEIYKYVIKVLTDSNEIFNKQHEHNMKSLNKDEQNMA